MPWDQVMHKAKHGKLHSGSKKGPIVKKKSQAVAIMLSEKSKAATNPEYAASDQASAIEARFGKKKRK